MSSPNVAKAQQIANASDIPAELSQRNKPCPRSRDAPIALLIHRSWACPQIRLTHTHLVYMYAGPKTAFLIAEVYLSAFAIPVTCSKVLHGRRWVD
jgi:hypothetical protein